MQNIYKAVVIKSVKLLLCIGSMLMAFESSHAQVNYLEDADFATLKNQRKLLEQIDIFLNKTAGKLFFQYLAA